MASGLFEYAEPNWRCYPCYVPNDTLIQSQWQLFQISAPGAWGSSSGAGITIAFTDSGISVAHPDVQHRVPGYNAVSNLAEVAGGDISDVNTAGHGTEVAGIACATGDNGIGVAGVAYSSNIMPIRVSNIAAGTALHSDILEGMQWAADHGAKVICTSYDGVFNSATEATGLYCWGKGAISVWAAGNQNKNTDDMPFGPGNPVKWDHPHIVVVGATQPDDTRASFSNYGRAIDFMAPGVGLITTEKNGGYSGPAGVLGTSFAAPIVAGCLANMIAAHPGFSLERQIRRLELAARDMGADVKPGDQGYNPLTYLAGNDLVYGWGRVNVDVALHPRQLRYLLTPIPMQGGATLCEASGINDRGDVVGRYGYSDGSSRPFLYSGGTVSILPRLLLPGSGSEDTTTRAVDINDSGQTLLDGNNRVGIWSAGAGLSHLDLRPEWIPQSTYIEAKRINNLGNSIATVYFGTTGTNALEQIWFGGIPVVYAIPPRSEFAYSINDNNQYLNHTGIAPSFLFPDIQPVARSLVDDEGVIIAAPFFDGPAQASLRDLSNAGFACGELAAGFSMTRSEDGTIKTFPPLVGSREILSSTNDSDICVGSTNASSSNNPIVHLGPEGAYLFQDMVVSLSNWSSLEAVTRINNRNEVIGMGTRVGSSALRSFIARPVTGVGVTIDLGSLGSNPIYLGALPPAFVVEFRSADNTPYPNSRRTYTYNSQTGRLADNATGTTDLITLPASVTGSYRIYARLTNSNDPDWNASAWAGCGYLGKLYPPMGDQPLPVDTASIPILELILGDCDSDNEISIGDFAILSQQYGTSGVSSADINGDDSVDIGDFAILSSNYGQSGD
jgi:hypothetical protein